VIAVLVAAMIGSRVAVILLLKSLLALSPLF
jgi:hypothetical protein